MTKLHSRLIWTLLLLLVAFIGYLSWQSMQKSEAPRGGNRPVAVTTAVVKQQPMIRSVSSLGTGIANQSVQLTVPANDYITQLNIQEGKAVNKGDVIAKLHDTEEQARVTELQAVLTDQKRQLERLKNLATTQATAQSMLDEQQTRVNATLAQLDIAKAQLQQMTITAPFDGFLGLRQVSVGAYVTSGTVLTTLDDLSPLRVEFSVAEHYLADIHVGMPLSVTNAAYGDIIFTGSVSAIDTRIDAVTRSVTVHGSVPNDDLRLRPGMLLNVKLELNNRTALQVAEKALVPQQNKQFVYLVDSENKVTRTEVTIGQRVPGWVEILSGVKEGDEVVVEGIQKLRDGSVVNKVGG